MNILSLLNKKSLDLKKIIYTNLIKDKNIETDCLNLITSILKDSNFQFAFHRVSYFFKNVRYYRQAKNS